MIKKLPQKLEGKLISEVFKVYCKRVEFFNSIPDSFYSFMIKIIDERIVLEGSQLFRVSIGICSHMTMTLALCSLWSRGMLSIITSIPRRVPRRYH